MVDPDDARFKSEIDEITEKISATLKKIEQVVPLKDPEPQDPPSEDATDTSD